MNPTIGPWFAKPGVKGTIDIRGSEPMNGVPYRVARVDDWKNGPADAQLIAAAPAMYEALTQIQKWLMDSTIITDPAFYNSEFVKANDLTVKALTAAKAPYTPDYKTNLGVD